LTTRQEVTVRITKVYTRTGDGGTTRLVGGQEVSKAHPRVEAYGSVDELSAIVGLARTFAGGASKAWPGMSLVAELLEQVQHDLFVLAGELATLPGDHWEGMPRLAVSDVQRLEHAVDRFNGELSPLEEFILAGGGVVSAYLHQARTVCRRVERQVVRLAEQPTEDGEPAAVASTLVEYLNRLADLLFVLARWSASTTGEPELTWKRR
jgi:cob(I)alamin adenosyltransferase